MNTINIQVAKIESVMSIDNRGIFKRLGKLLEEQGELYEAYLLSNKEDILEEAIDNLIVLVSLAYEINKDSLFQIGHIANKGYKYGADDIHETTDLYKTNLLMKYSINIGKMADSIQKHENIISSRYKGLVTPEETLLSISDSIFNLMHFVSKISNNPLSINNLIIKKVAKWHEKVS
jgi:hypothetical protein